MSAPKFNVPAITLVAKEDLTVIQVPKEVTEEERMLVVGAWISTLGGLPTSHRAVVECVYNLLLLGIPEMAAVTNSMTSLKYTVITPTRGDLMTWVKLQEGTLTAEGGKLPPLMGAVKPEAHAVTKMEAIYIALASLLFCLGKQATESARASVLDNRPDALIRRFGLGEGDQALLPGKEAGPSREVLETIYNAFSNYTEVRTAIVLFFLGVKRSGHHLPIHMEIMMTNFQLMRGAGMTHVEAVMKLIRAQAWTLRVPKLRPSYQKFLEDLEKFEAIEEDVRPYHRLLVPQSQYLFLSSELRPLVAVAGSFLEEVEATFQGYVYNKANYQGLIDEVKKYAPNYHPTTGLARLAELLGVKEEPLPTLKPVEKTAQTETV